MSGITSSRFGDGGDRRQPERDWLATASLCSRRPGLRAETGVHAPSGVMALPTSDWRRSSQVETRAARVPRDQQWVQDGGSPRVPSTLAPAVAGVVPLP